ncbi:MAG: asparagine synthase-related protein [Methanobacteriota archaeon]
MAGNESVEDYPYRAEAHRMGIAISKACETATGGRDKVAVAFSGGLDSALLAFICANHTEVKLYVAGKPGCHDFRAAESAARALSLPLARIEIERGGLQAVAERVASAVDNPAPIEIAVAVPLAYVCGAAVESAVVTGTGADELFGGYARYSRMPSGERLGAMRCDYGRLKVRGVATEANLASSYGKVAIQPYMDPVVELAFREVGIGAHFWNGRPKALLRYAAVSCGLPMELAMRPKKAAQYGSGVARMLSKARGNS